MLACVQITLFNNTNSPLLPDDRAPHIAFLSVTSSFQNWNVPIVLMILLIGVCYIARKVASVSVNYYLRNSPTQVMRRR